MTREEAARMLHPDMCRKESMAYNADEWWEAYWEARKMGAEALQPWVRTADRKPALADANKDGHVYAYDMSGYKQIDGQIGEPGIRVMHYQTVRIHHASFLWWMPIPPLPEEVEE